MRDIDTVNTCSQSFIAEEISSTVHIIAMFLEAGVAPQPEGDVGMRTQCLCSEDRLPVRECIPTAAKLGGYFKTNVIICPAVIKRHVGPVTHQDCNVLTLC